MPSSSNAASAQSTSLTDTWPSFAAAAREGASGEALKGLRIGVVTELPDAGFQQGVSASFRAALSTMAAHGAEIVEISAPHFEYAGGKQAGGPSAYRIGSAGIGHERTLRVCCEPDP